MIANHIHDALAQVRKLQEVILEKRSFRGYSGTARMLGGVVALTGAAILDSSMVPRHPGAHLVGWALVLAVALAVNYGALTAWFFRDPEVCRDWRRLMPAADALPALAVGAVLSVALVLHGNLDMLFGTWMCLYGLVHVVYRQSLPASNYGVGLFYMTAGTLCLVTPTVSFLDPWPMGIVFLAGETAGGFVLQRNRRKE